MVELSYKSRISVKFMYHETKEGILQSYCSAKRTALLAVDANVKNPYVQKCTGSM